MGLASVYKNIKPIEIIHYYSNKLQRFCISLTDCTQTQTLFDINNKI